MTTPAPRDPGFIAHQIEEGLRLFSSWPRVVRHMIVIVAVMAVIGLLWYGWKQLHPEKETSPPAQAQKIKGDGNWQAGRDVIHNNGIDAEAHRLALKMANDAHDERRRLSAENTDVKRQLQEARATIASLEAAPATSPADKKLLEQANAAMRRGDTDTARDLFLQYDSMHSPDLAAVHYALGVTFTDAYRFSEALPHYQKAQTLQPQNTRYQYGLGMAYYQLNDYQRALPLLQRLETSARQQCGDRFLSVVLDVLGTLYRSRRDFPAAKEAYTEALRLRRALAQQKPQAYTPDVAMTLNNLGTLYSDTRDFPAAKEAYTEALRLRRALAQQKPQAYTSDVAMTLHNLGTLYRDIRDFPAAKKAYAEALDLYRTLAQQKPQAYMPDVAMTLHNLGIFYWGTHDFPAAKGAYAEALDLYRTLAQQEPQVYTPDVAMTLHNLGILYRDTRDFLASKEAYDEALRLRRALAQQEPHAYTPDVATTLHNLGPLYSDIRDFAAAKEAFEEALVLWQALAEQHPRAYLQHLFCALRNMVLFYRDKAPDARRLAEIEAVLRKVEKQGEEIQ